MSLKIGLQLYSVREGMKKDPIGTLEAVAKAGYRYIEAANHNAAQDDGIGFGVGAKEMKTTLDRLGLSIVGCHVNPLDLERLPSVLDYHAQLGNRQIGCDIEFYPYGNPGHLLRRCDLFNQVGALCRERGMRFYYHNHYQEFQLCCGRPVYELILENTDPELVFVEIDTYWAIRGGADPLALIQRYRDRLLLLHQKDFPAVAPQPLCVYDGPVTRYQNITREVFEQTLDPGCFTEIGTGVLPIAEIIRAAQDAPHLAYMILEQDHSAHDELTSIQISRRALEQFEGVSFD